jgi:alkylhydroperoxidase family enzyme
VAREQGLTEEQTAAITDAYEDSTLTARDVAALRLTDAIIGDPRGLTPEVQAELRTHFSEPEIVELALGVALFLSMSKVLITLGLEPEAMPVTVLPTPGTR